MPEGRDTAGSGTAGSDVARGADAHRGVTGRVERAERAEPHMPWTMVPDADLASLRARLAARASAEGLVDVAYRSLDTDLGTLLVAATPVGLVSVTFDGADPTATLERLADVLGPRVLEDRPRLDAAARELDALIDGSARRFEGALDLTLAHGFRREVVQELRGIPYGQTRTYREVAEAVGSPRAVRAVGTACARNPLPIAVPCHRVVRSDGSIGRYAGGVDAKRTLLAVESARSVAGHDAS